MTAEFDGLVAIVTGGASGIGAAIAAALSEAGATVAVLDLNTDGVPEPALAVTADVGSDESVRARWPMWRNGSAASTS